MKVMQATYLSIPDLLGGLAAVATVIFISLAAVSLAAIRKGALLTDLVSILLVATVGTVLCLPIAIAWINEVAEKPMLAEKVLAEYGIEHPDNRMIVTRAIGSDDPETTIVLPYAESNAEYNNGKIAAEEKKYAMHVIKETHGEGIFPTIIVKIEMFDVTNTPEETTYAPAA